MNARPLVVILLLSSSVASAQDYRFPIKRPTSGTQPYITAHRDNNDGAALDDYACGNETYNNHKGTDIGIGGFAVMDNGSRTVVAAAPGEVAAVRDGCYDRCTTGSCDCADGFGNYVRVDHPDGKRTYYGHLKKNSLLVSVGDDVSCGTPLGKVGSSGNSTGPHLHFEVRHANNTSDDPYSGNCGGPTSYWVSQGSYGGLPGDACEGGTEPPPPPPETGTVRGVVFEDQGVGTANMTVRIPGATVRAGGTSTTADSPDANWTLSVTAGSVTVRAEAPGYVSGQRTCTVTAGETTWCSLGLARNEPEPEPEPEPVDAGPAPIVDAGAPVEEPDAGVPVDEPDAGIVDEEDAGAPTAIDAGSPVDDVDAGVPVPPGEEDAGSTEAAPDAGGTTEDPGELDGEGDPVIVEPEPESPSAPTGGGCASSPPEPWALALLAVALRRRKR